MSRLGRLGRGGLLLGAGLLIFKLLVLGQLHYYLSPSFDGLTALTGLVLVIMGGLEVWHAWRAVPDRHPSHAELDAALTLGLVAVPLVAGLLLAPRALGTDGLGGTPVSRLVLAYDAAPAAPGAVPAPRQPIADVGDLLSYLRVAGEGGVGQPVHARGLVARSDDLPSNEFVLVRYAIVHCVADAQPLGLLVVGAGDSRALQTDQWVEVAGTLASDERDGDHLVSIHAAQIRPSEEPSEPYIAAF